MKSTINDPRPPIFGQDNRNGGFGPAFRRATEGLFVGDVEFVRR